LIFKKMDSIPIVWVFFLLHLNVSQVFAKHRLLRLRLQALIPGCNSVITVFGAPFLNRHLNYEK
jgi:hypothetical protein